MRADLMVWTQRLVAAVFLVGVFGLGATVVTLVRQAEGVPPLPVYVGLLGLVALLLLAGACMALISIAISARRGTEALRRLASQTVGAAPVAGPVTGPVSGGARPFSASPLREVAQQPEPDQDPVAAPARPARPSGRKLVAER